ncbi:MAG: aminotransferase class V-fold PLP-dependent enzyme [Actinomycetaceae bacterium]|nr:aminotransferase class V-fold PLP-dependent enzyme [Actinomycetaceae bacterium]
MSIPAEILPRDGRFGSGPSRPRSDAFGRAGQADSRVIGTSHRQEPVKSLVGRVRRCLAELFRLPDDYEVLLGNGGASLVWDALAFTGVDGRAQAAVFGEFSSKAAKAISRVPWADCVRIEAEPGLLATCQDGRETRANDPAGAQELAGAGELAGARDTAGARDAGFDQRSGSASLVAEGAKGSAAPEEIDAYLYPHNETSTGVLSPVRRFGSDSALTLVDATSAAGGVDVDIAQTDLYYFSPQKCFGADGGLWLALASPAAIERIERLAAARWVPDVLNLALAVKNSRADQTLNTPSIVNLLAIAEQAEWMLSAGGLGAMDARTRASSTILYEWAEARDYAAPFVAPEHRSNVVVTIDLDESVPSAELRSHLRANGIVDIDPYRSLGRNQIRVGTFPNVEADDVRALTECIDYVVARM